MYFGDRKVNKFVVIHLLWKYLGALGYSNTILASDLSSGFSFWPSYLVLYSKLKKARSSNFQKKINCKSQA